MLCARLIKPSKVASGPDAAPDLVPVFIVLSLLLGSSGFYIINSRFKGLFIASCRFYPKQTNGGG